MPFRRRPSQLTDWIGRQLTYYQQLGKPGAMMSGSGSAASQDVNNLDEGHLIANQLIELGLPSAYVLQPGMQHLLNNNLNAFLEST